jgi:hypothetical protein
MNRIINLARAIADLFEPVPDFVTTAQLTAALGVERADYQTLAHIREWMWQQGWRSTVHRVDGIHVRGYAKPSGPIDEAGNLRALITQYGNASYRHDVGAASALGKKINALLDAKPDAATTTQPETPDGDLLKWLIDALSCEALIEVGIFPFVMSSDSDWRVLVEDAMRARAKRSQVGTGRTMTSKALKAVIAERLRQQSDEGWTPEHDDEHVNDELAAMAAYYAMPVGARDWPASETGYGATFGEAIRPEGWQAKDGDRWDELVKAGALVLSELERLERADAVLTGGAA